MGPPRPTHCISIGVDARGGKSSEYIALARLFASHFEAEGSLVDPIDARNSLKNPPWSPSWDAVCVVSHGYFDPLDPESTGLVVCRPGGMWGEVRIVLHRRAAYGFNDFPFIIAPMESSLPATYEPEVMTTAELKVSRPTSAELAALIGCHSGAGWLRAGDDFHSLAYQWLKFGAASVLASGWQLDLAEDIATWAALSLFGDWL